jgi:hypothetical protein
MELLVMIEISSIATKILVVDSDEASFQIRKCIASVSTVLPMIDLIYAHDASEALLLIDTHKPDVILFNSDDPLEVDLLLESLSYDHPPVVFQSDGDLQLPTCLAGDDENITFIPNDDTLEGIHDTLELVIAIGEKFAGHKPSASIH